jgi:hypothetical protein
LVEHRSVAVSDSVGDIDVGYEEIRVPFALRRCAPRDRAGNGTATVLRHDVFGLRLADGMERFTHGVTLLDAIQMAMYIGMQLPRGFKTPRG